jgi:hypothetical protein
MKYDFCCSNNENGKKGVDDENNNDNNDKNRKRREKEIEEMTKFLSDDNNFTPLPYPLLLPHPV